MTAKISSIPKPNSLASHYMTKNQLAEALGVSSTRVVDGLMAGRMIPYMKLGHRTVRFDYARVAAALIALERFEVRASG